ncbi:hypothetical protein HMP06_0295 [Sphingomonas sp. HMP6]|nr:hypothetical protein HMP06_0295 [Sphingomonas sp. HMP6]
MVLPLRLVRGKGHNPPFRVSLSPSDDKLVFGFSRDLQRVLGEWATTGSGFHLYYSGRRHRPTGLRLLIDLIKEVRPLVR